MMMLRVVQCSGDANLPLDELYNEDCNQQEDILPDLNIISILLLILQIVNFILLLLLLLQDINLSSFTEHLHYERSE